MGINASVIEKTGLVGRNEQDKIIYPPFFQVTDDQGGKILYKLKYLQKGTFVKQDKNTGAIIPDTEFTLDADTQNLYAEEMTGLGAVYEQVSPVLDKAIVPWFWKLNELDTFIQFSTLQQSEEAPVVAREAEENAPQLTAEQQAILNRLANAGLPQTIEEVAAATPVVTTTPPPAPVSTPAPAVSEENIDEAEVQKLMKFGVTREKAIELIKKKIKQSKSSAKQPINQAALTNILDKLALKFGISWRYDNSIPGLGQFKDGEVLINPDKAKADTPFHEFAHPFIAIVKIQNPYLYNNLMNQLTKSDVGIKTLEKVKKLYPELTYEQQIEEAIVDVIGQYAADAQSIKKEKGLWNAIKTFLRRVSEYIKSLLSDSQKKIIPSELDPNTTMQELASMLVIDNPIDLGPLLSRSYKKPTKVKPGVAELFESNPELASIGTQEQYSQYLDTIFPDSKVKDIVYHGSKNKIDKVSLEETRKSQLLKYPDLPTVDAFFLTPSKITAKAMTSEEAIINPALINSKNPLKVTTSLVKENNISTLAGTILFTNSPEMISKYKKLGYDTFDSSSNAANEYVVFEPEQIHILGSKQDIEGFKEFANQSTRPQLNNVSTLFNTFANVSDADVLELINECN